MYTRAVQIHSLISFGGRKSSSGKGADLVRNKTATAFTENFHNATDLRPRN